MARKIDAIIMLFLMVLAGGLGYTIRGVVDDYVEWLDTPIVVAKDPAEEYRPKTACVTPDEWTLSHIAAAFYPDRPVDEVVKAILEANPGLDPCRLQIGQVVVLP